jgi:glutathione S-transferase
MKLFYAPGACSLSPHIVAVEAGVPIGLVKVDLRSHKTEDGRDYYAINPKGYVPALEMDDGSILTEGPAIVQYLADRNPASGLAPAAGTVERYRLQEWLGFIGTEIHKTWGPLWNPALPADQRQATLERLGGRFGYVVKALQGKPFLTGNGFTAADAYLFVVLNWAPMTKVDLSAWPALQEFAARVRARPKVQQALKEEGLA